VNILQIGRSRRHIARLLDATLELDENVRLLTQELAKDHHETTVACRTDLALARCALQVAIERLHDAESRLPSSTLRVVA